MDTNDNSTEQGKTFELSCALVENFLNIHDNSFLDHQLNNEIPALRLSRNSVNAEVETPEVPIVGEDQAKISLLERLVKNDPRHLAEIHNHINEDTAIDHIVCNTESITTNPCSGLTSREICKSISDEDTRSTIDIGPSLSCPAQYEYTSNTNKEEDKSKLIDPMECQSTSPNNSHFEGDRATNIQRDQSLVEPKIIDGSVTKEEMHTVDKISAPRCSPLFSPYANTRRASTPSRPHTALVTKREKMGKVRRISTPNQHPRAIFVNTEPIRKIREKLKITQENRRCSSRESWIPENIRRKMVQRDFSVAKINQHSREKYRVSRIKNLSKLKPNTLERSISKEKYGIEQRKACGLCYRQFLPENLVLAVTLKAILDLRETWGTRYDPDISRIKINPNLKRAPLCYNETRVCVFCAQLFDNQEMYRPSWKAKQAEQRRLKIEQEALLQKIAADPLVGSQQGLKQLR